MIDTLSCILQFVINNVFSTEKNAALVYKDQTLTPRTSLIRQARRNIQAALHTSNFLYNLLESKAFGLVFEIQEPADRHLDRYTKENEPLLCRGAFK